MAFIRVGPEDFDLATEMVALRDTAGDIGALAAFVGVVRGDAARPMTAMTLEHYPGMTERSIAAVAAEAETRFALSACRIIHRTGRIPLGGQIVLVLTAAAHRQPALDATAFLIDWLKIAAPFWKKEHLADGTETWVEARAADDSAAARWQTS